MPKLLSKSRYLILLAVFGSLVCATILLVYGAVHAVELGVLAGNSQLSGKKLAIATIELVDYFLLATVFYIVAVGLYELFIGDIPQVPEWLLVRDLDELKSRLLGVVVTVLGVLFLGQIVGWDGQKDLMGYGFAVAAVIAAITFYESKK